MSHRKVAVLVATMLVLGGSRVLADTPLPNGNVRITSGDAELITPNGRYYIPVGSHILDGTSWDKLDTEVKRLQDEVTRKTAENKSLKNAVTSWSPGWGTLIVLGVITAGVSGYYHFR